MLSRAPLSLREVSDGSANIATNPCVHTCDFQKGYLKTILRHDCAWLSLETSLDGVDLSGCRLLSSGAPWDILVESNARGPSPQQRLHLYIQLSVP